MPDPTTTVRDGDTVFIAAQDIQPSDQILVRQRKPEGFQFPEFPEFPELPELPGDRAL